MKKYFAVILIVSLAATAAVKAEMISYTNTYGPTGVEFSGLTVPLLKFDPALGTLTKVTINLDANTDSGLIAWDNEAGISSDVILGIGAQVTATTPLGLVTVVAVPLQTGSGNVDADNDGAADFIGTDAFAISGGSGSDSDEDFTTTSLATFIAAFAGETFDMTVDSVAETYVSTTGGFGPIAPVTGLTDGLVSVTYEYSIPEPGTIALFGLFGGAIMILRRFQLSV